MRRVMPILLAALIVCTNTICLCTTLMAVTPVEAPAPVPVSCCAAERPVETDPPAHPVDCDSCNLHRDNGALAAIGAEFRPVDAPFLFTVSPSIQRTLVVLAESPADRGLVRPPRSHLGALALIGRFVL